jgi:hypothetical protein
MYNRTTFNKVPLTTYGYIGLSIVVLATMIFREPMSVSSENKLPTIADAMPFQNDETVKEEEEEEDILPPINGGSKKTKRNLKKKQRKTKRAIIRK